MLHAQYEGKQKVKAILVYLKSDIGSTKKDSRYKQCDLPSFVPHQFSLSFE
jgi:hypothetical protein